MIYRKVIITGCEVVILPSVLVHRGTLSIFLLLLLLLNIHVFVSYRGRAIC